MTTEEKMLRDEEELKNGFSEHNFKAEEAKAAEMLDMSPEEKLESGNIVKHEPNQPRRAPGYSVEDLDNLFTYHAPKGDQAKRYGKISAAMKEAARVVLENTPPCADQTIAIRQIMLARMMANATIACNE